MISFSIFLYLFLGSFLMVVLISPVVMVMDGIASKGNHGHIASSEDGNWFARDLISTGVERYAGKNERSCLAKNVVRAICFTGFGGCSLASSAAFLSGMTWAKVSGVPETDRTAILVSVVAFTLTGLILFNRYRKGWLRREIVAAKGDVLDWDAEASVFDIDTKIRFDSSPHKVTLNLSEDMRISSDEVLYRFKHLVAKPDLVQDHGNGWIVLEYKSLSGTKAPHMGNGDWIARIRLKDMLQAIVAAYVTSRACNVCVACVLRYPGATIILKPSSDHIKWLKSIGYRLCKERNVPDVSASDLANFSEEAFREDFSEVKVKGLIMHREFLEMKTISL